jgi:hypothetical protein
MTERELEKAVAELCHEFGLWRYHVADARSMRAGLPDDLIIGNRGAIWRELKSETGELSWEQEVIGNQFKRLGWDWAVWRPSDLMTGQIRQELEKIS